MTSSQTLLDQLRARTTVDCDTLDVTVPKNLGPFEDCTSNQAIAYFELLHTHHESLIRDAAATAKELSSKYTDIKLESLAVEICV